MGGIIKFIVGCLAILIGIAIVGLYPLAAVVVVAIGIVGIFVIFGRDEY